MVNKKSKTKIIFYQSAFHQIGGVETMAYNWCWWLRNFFDITVLYYSADSERLRNMSKLVKMEIYDENKTYECDIFIRNSVWGKVPNNIKARRMIEMRHANYKYLIEKGLLYQQYKDMGIKEIIGCGEFVSKMSDEVLHDHPTTIKNILLPRKETNKILRLISCTRLDPAKGWNRMLKMAQMMKDANIKFTWDIFTNSTDYKTKNNFEEIHFWKQRYDIWDYLANADYTVLLSDSEGLPYTVQESLQYQVPCIVSDVGGCTELIKDGVNGYVVPLDMNFDIKKITKIPKCSEYDNHALEDWLNYLGYNGKIDKQKIIDEMEKEKNMKAKVIALKKFEGIRDAERNVFPKENEEWICSKERADYLVANNVVKIKEIIEEEIPKIENVEKIMWEKENGKVVASNYDETETKIKVKKTTKKKTSKK